MYKDAAVVKGLMKGVGSWEVLDYWEDLVVMGRLRCRAAERIQIAPGVRILRCCPFDLFDLMVRLVVLVNRRAEVVG